MPEPYIKMTSDNFDMDGEYQISNEYVDKYSLSYKNNKQMSFDI